MNASSAILSREVGADSHRVSLGGDWSTMKVLPGGFTFEPFAELRGDYYLLDKAVSGEESVACAVGNAGAKIAYPMIRPGTNVDLMIEPAVMAAWGSRTPMTRPSRSRTASSTSLMSRTFLTPTALATSTSMRATES